MSETNDFGPSAQELERFDDALPSWLAGQLSESDAAWMEEMQARHQELAMQALWLRDARLAMREEAATQDTQAAWELLQERIHMPDKTEHKPATDVKASRWLQWLFGNPGWANAVAGLAAVLIVGQAIWIAAGMTPDVRPMQQDTPAWRSLDFDDLLAGDQGVRVQLHLKAQSLSADLNLLARSLDGQSASVWQPQADGSWILHMQAQGVDAQQLLSQLRQSPLVEKVQLLP